MSSSRQRGNIRCTNVLYLGARLKRLDWKYNPSEMEALLNQILAFLTGQPGNVFYHYALVLSIGIALYSAFNNWRSSEFPQARRTMLGLGLLLLAQFLMFSFSALGWQGLMDPTFILPPLDRAFTLLSIVILVWLWAFPEPSRVADGATVLLVLLIAVASVLSLLTWAPQAASITYNRTSDELIWQAASLGFLGLGTLVLATRRPNGFANGLVMLIMVLAGHAIHLIMLEDGNYSGVVRLAYLAAFPILVTLPQRFPAPAAVQERAVASKQSNETPVRTERRRYSTDPKTFHSMLALAAEANPAKVSQGLARGVAQSMLADLCFLIFLTDNKNQLMMAGGYDLIREDKVEGGTLDKAAVPMLASAIQRGRPLRLPDDPLTRQQRLWDWMVALGVAFYGLATFTQNINPVDPGPAFYPRIISVLLLAAAVVQRLQPPG